MSGGARPLGLRGRLILGGIGVGIVALVAVANAHLVHVALASAPGCVAQAGEGGYRAARPAC